MSGKIDTPYCQTCKLALETVTAYGGRAVLGYKHSTALGQVDHEPDPVPLEQCVDPIIKCDFCSGTPSSYLYRCEDQITQSSKVIGLVASQRDYQDKHYAAPAQRLITRPGHASVWGEVWAACKGCSYYIDMRDVSGLVTRVVERLPSKLTRGKKMVQARGAIYSMYEGFFRTVQPARGRITPEQPLGVWDDEDSSE